jgi:murein DD-endopeptidase MepM/ murein hydrolase activator NlpD
LKPGAGPFFDTPTAAPYSSRPSHFVYSNLQRGLGRAALCVVGVAAIAWCYLQLDTRTLPGLRVGGELLPRTHDASRLLASRAQAWGELQLSIITGPHLTRAKRKQLGAQINARAIAQQAERLGRSGNPLLDLWVAGEAALHGRDIPWVPRVDRLVLGRYVRAIRNNVERPPLAGARDRSGWSIPGVPGLALDTERTAAAVERALRVGSLSVTEPLRQVAAPQTVEIGSPDAVLYDDEHGDEHDTSWVPRAASSGAFDSAALAAARPRYWLPTQGRECMDPPYERFCQGPRQVALPFGSDAELAERLELGGTRCVGWLLNSAPRPAWVAAAGGPTARRSTMTWPAQLGRLWRRFGYVRKPPFEQLLHRGIDVGAPRGSPVIATNPGIVAYSDNGIRGYGNLLVIVHDDASVTFSAHCQAIFVFAGQHVRAGQIVGEVGDTGMARGAHVHFEYHVLGEPADPLRLFGSL